MKCLEVRNGIIKISKGVNTATIEISAIKLDTATKQRKTSQVINRKIKRGTQNYPLIGIITFHSCKIW